MRYELSEHEWTKILGVSRAFEQQVRFAAIATRPSILALNLMASPLSTFRAVQTEH